MDPSKRKYCTRQNQKLPMMEPTASTLVIIFVRNVYVCVSLCVSLCVSAKMKIWAEGAARRAKRDCVQAM